MITTSETDTPIAMWIGNNGEREIIHIDTNPKIKKEELKGDYDQKDIDDAMVMYKINKKNIDEYEKEIVEKIKIIFFEHKIFEAYNGVFELLPNPYKSERLYLCGPSECGKSYLIMKYIQKYKKIYPDKQIFLVSDTKDDAKLNDLDLERIDENYIHESFRKLKKNEERKVEKLTLKEFENSLMIFDDIDSFTGDLKTSVYNFCDNIYKNGRQNNISIIRTNHAAVEGNETKSAITNSDIIIVYPQSGNSGTIKNLLRFHGGMKLEDQKHIVNMNTRWVAIRKTSPLTLISENLIKIL